MQNLKVHEHIVLDTLVSGIISADTMSDIKNEPTISAYDITDNGYFITLKHPDLPEERIVCDKPIIIGECNGIKTGFVIFIENNELTIECHGWGNHLIPKNYRELDVKVKKA